MGVAGKIDFFSVLPHSCYSLQLFTSAVKTNEQDHYLLLADGFILVYEITSKASYDLVVSIRQKIASKNKEVQCHI